VPGSWKVNVHRVPKRINEVDLTVIRQFAAEEFLEMDLPILDVRSLGEHQRGHIPGSHSFPLFTDEERAMVGTLYKQEGRDAAVLEGLKIVGPRLSTMVEEAQRIAPNGEVRVHCWRGGERSGSVAWLLDKTGFKEVVTLRGGYKFFRRHVLSWLERPFDLRVIGGYTGTGKTEIIRALKERGEQVVDLEAIAHHKGSAFGALGQLPQPSTEHFENLLWRALSQLDASRPIWVEDESLMIGTVRIPTAFFELMRSSALFFMQMPLEIRVERLVNEYGIFSTEELATSIQRIGKRLGPQHVKEAMIALEAGDLLTTAQIALRYYDKAYDRGITGRDQNSVIRMEIDENMTTTVDRLKALALSHA
jgi:tRNA 2-selenouridine synthase